jgi:hypothetical protein
MVGALEQGEPASARRVSESTDCENAAHASEKRSAGGIAWTCDPMLAASLTVGSLPR